MRMKFVGRMRARQTGDEGTQKRRFAPPRRAKQHGMTLGEIHHERGLLRFAGIIHHAHDSTHGGHVPINRLPCAVLS